LKTEIRVAIQLATLIARHGVCRRVTSPVNFSQFSDKNRLSTYTGVSRADVRV
jgi:hypothetical protein